MKICYVVTRLISSYNIRFLKKFNEQGYNVKCVIFAAKDFKIPDEYTELENIEYIIVLPFCRFYKFFGIINLFWKVYQLRKVLKTFKPDILHSGYIKFDSWVASLSGYHPFLVMGWGTDILIDAFENIWNFLKIRYAIKKADGLTCDSKYQAEYMCKIGGNLDEKKVVTFPWGIDLNIFNKNTNVKLREQLGWEDKIVLIRTRNIVEVYGKDLYGHNLFVTAFAKAYEKNNNLRLIVIGDGNLRKDIIKRLEQISPDCYKYFGRINSEEIVDYLNAADIYVNTSISDGTSSCMMEAMACGLPIITTDIFVNYEWITDYINGFIVPKYDSEKLCEKILELSNDKKFRDECQKNNIKLAETKLDWNKNFYKLVELYKDMREKK